MVDLVNATAEVSRSQAQRLAELAQSLQQVASISTASSDSANSTAAATETQITAMGELTATSQQLAQLAERDRKSTRLNSSHSQISYAVFCLKKKKHNINSYPDVTY